MKAFNLIYSLQAYIFRDYWEDIGTIKSFYDANLSLADEVIIGHSIQVIPCSMLIWINYSINMITLQFPKFEFYDPKTPFYTSPRFLPPTKIDNCKVS